MNSHASSAPHKRSALLDCIRAFAVIMVLIYHVSIEYPPVAVDMFAGWFANYGLLGVDLFFPLSGYLITSFLLERHTGSDIRVFFLRRFFRIVPVYFLALAVYFIASAVTGHGGDNIGQIWQNFLFLTGWTIFHLGRDTVPYTISWSLSVEEFAYILIGLSAFFLGRRIIFSLLGLCMISIGLRYFLTSQGYAQVYFYPPARLDSIAIGGLVAWAGSQQKHVLFPLILTLSISIAIGQTGPVAKATTIYISIALLTCLIIHVIRFHLPDFRSGLIRAVGSIGFYSYFIYLFHYFNVMGLILLFERVDLFPSFWFFCLIALFVTFVQAWMSYRFFEGPLMDIGRRLESRSASLSASGSA